MRLTSARIALVAIVLALGFALPACKKKSKSTEQDPSDPNPVPGGPGPAPGPGQRDPAAPRSPVYSGLGEAQMRPIAKNNLRQIGLALHNYHDINNGLPVGFVDKTGKLGLSWRVAILPYVEQEGLYKQFKLDEPWDSATNRPLIDKMPAIYAPPRQSTNGYTFLRGFSGPNTWLPPQSGPRPQGIRLTSITDGSSNTALVIEAYDPVIWTKPDELEFAPNKVPAVGGVFSSGTNVLMADGDVRYLRKGFDPKMLALLIQINDGQLVQFDD